MSVPRLDPGEQAAWGGFLAAHAELWRLMEARLAGVGLSLNDYRVLVSLEKAGPAGMRMAPLAERVLMTTGGFSRLVDRLEVGRLVERRRVETDGRGSLAVLTPAGQAALDRAREIHLSDVREHFLVHLDANDVERLGAIWERVRAPLRPPGSTW